MRMWCYCRITWLRFTYTQTATNSSYDYFCLFLLGIGILCDSFHTHQRHSSEIETRFMATMNSPHSQAQHTAHTHSVNATIYQLEVVKCQTDCQSIRKHTTKMEYKTNEWYKEAREKPCWTQSIWSISLLLVSPNGWNKNWIVLQQRLWNGTLSFKCDSALQCTI